MTFDQTVFTALLSGLQTLVLLLFCDARWKMRFAGRYKSLLLFIFSAMTGLGVYSLCRIIHDEHMSFSFFYTIGLQLALCAWLYGGMSRIKGLFVIFSNVLYSIALLLSLMVSVLLIPYAGKRIGTSRLGIIMNLVFQLLCFLIIFLLREISDISELTFLPSLPGWIGIFTVYALIYAASIYVSDTLIRGNLVTAVSPVIETALLVVCTAVYILFLRACQGYNDRIQHALMEKQLSMQRDHLNEIQASGDAMRKLRHELKNHMFYMQYLIDKRDFDALTGYFQEFYRKEHHHLESVDVSGGILSAVLQQKTSLAEQYDIRIMTDLQCAAPAAIDEQDLCILFSNLLDNAIEACTGLENAVISVRMKQVKEYLSLVVSNTVDQDILKENPFLITKKENREIHGIGIKVIREIVRKYDGSLVFSSDIGMFHAKLMVRIGGDHS